MTVDARDFVADDPAAYRSLDDWDADRLARLADAHGTPLYVTDLDRVRANYRRLEAAFDGERVLYAAKANTGRTVLSTLLAEGAGLECAAAGELQRAVAAGADPGDLQYTAVNPPADDLDYVVGLWEDHPGLAVTAGAADTLTRLADRGFDGRLLVRVNPGTGAGHHEAVAAGGDAKFGVPRERVAGVVERAREDFDFAGLHAHVGSGVLVDGLPDYLQALAAVGDVAREVGPVDVLDVGGGLGVPYRADEAPLDLLAVAGAVRAALGDVGADVTVEPGRALVADAGLLLARVTTRKETPAGEYEETPAGEYEETPAGEESPADTVVGVDASMCTLLRPATFDAVHPVRNLSGAGRPPESVTVAGPLCTGADVFPTDRPLSRPEAGDLLAVGNAGAYGYEFTSTFHSQPRPAVVALAGGESRVVRERETVADLTRLEQG